MNDDEQTLEIFNERIFNVSQEILFDAFADPQKLMHWWGPNGFTNVIHTFEFKPDGIWHFTMCALDGTEFENTSVFKEIIAQQRIVFVHNLPIHVFTMIMNYEPIGANTKLTWRMLFEPTQENAELKHFIAAANEQNFDRLENFLKRQTFR